MGSSQKRLLCLCRVRTPVPETFQEECTLESGGVWGYVFNYSVNKLCFYQLEEGESVGPLAVKAMLTSVDCTVLNLVALNNHRPPPSTAVQELSPLPVDMRSPKSGVADEKWSFW